MEFRYIMIRRNDGSVHCVIMEYKCPDCGETYTSTRGFPRVQAVKGEKNPTGPRGHGYHSVCPNCGHEFYGDNQPHWVDEISHGGNDFRISTVFLYLNHGHDGEDLWYETMIFGFNNDPMWRYETEGEAVDNHKKILYSLKRGHYHIEKGSLYIEVVDLCENCGNINLYSDKREEWFCPFCDLND